jgi:hypothetical protein
MEKVLCRFCKEEISKEAKRCPHCQSWLTRWGLDLNNPKAAFFFFSILFFILMPLLIIFMFYSEDYIQVSNRKSEVASTVLKITESSLHTFKCGDSECIVILGTIDNRSNSSWGYICFHVGLFDSDGQLIDTFSDYNYDIVVPSNSSTAFRVSRTAIRDLSKYSKHRISIRWASKMRG